MRLKLGRVTFVTRLLGRARALLHGLGPKGEHPSRVGLHCDQCGCEWHSAFRYWRGWLIWHLVCRPWPITPNNFGIPPLLEYAGDCMFDARECDCRHKGRRLVTSAEL